MNCTKKGAQAILLLIFGLLAAPPMWGQRIGWIMNSNSVISDSAGNYSPHSFCSHLYRTGQKGFTTTLRFRNNPVKESISFDREGRITQLRKESGEQLLSAENFVYEEDCILSPGRFVERGFVIPQKPQQFLNGNLLAAPAGICNAVKYSSDAPDLVTIFCGSGLTTANRTSRDSATISKYSTRYGYSAFSTALKYASYYPALGKVLTAFEETLRQSSGHLLTTYYNQNPFVPNLDARYEKENFLIGFQGKLTKGSLFYSGVFRDLPRLTYPAFPTSKYDILEYQFGGDSVSEAVQISIYEQRGDSRNGYNCYLSAVIGDQKYLVAYSSYYGGIMPSFHSISVIRMPLKFRKKQTILVKNYRYYTRANVSPNSGFGADSLVFSEEKGYLKTRFNRKS